nr:hypothetical protein [Calliblepharis sp.]
MNNFWKNVKQFLIFIISVFLGFFLTTIYPFFKLLKNKKQKSITILIMIIITLIIYNTLRLMIGIT